MLSKNKTKHLSNWKRIYVFDNNKIIFYELTSSGRLSQHFCRSKPRNLDELIHKMENKSMDSKNQTSKLIYDDVDKKNDLNLEVADHCYDESIYELFDSFENCEANL